MTARSTGATIGDHPQKPSEDHEHTDDGRTAKHAFDAANETAGAVRVVDVPAEREVSQG